MQKVTETVWIHEGEKLLVRVNWGEYQVPILSATPDKLHYLANAIKEALDEEKERKLPL